MTIAANKDTVDTDMTAANPFWEIEETAHIARDNYFPGYVGLAFFLEVVNFIKHSTGTSQLS